MKRRWYLFHYAFKCADR